MIFKFQEIIKDFRNEPSRTKLLEQYEQHVEPIGDDITALCFYREYLQNFKTVPIVPPFGYPTERSDRDWVLLFSAASFSTKSKLEIQDDGQLELVFQFLSEKQKINKAFSDLFLFQVSHSFFIYIEEQIKLETLRHTNKEERQKIDRRRQEGLENWNNYVNRTLAKRLIQDFVPG